MSGIQSVGNLCAKIENLVDSQRLLLNSVFERRTVQVFHGDESAALLVADIVDGANIGMIQGGSRLRFALKTGQGLEILGHIIGQEFQRYKSVKASVLSSKHHTHATATDFFEDAIVRNCLTDERVGIRHGSRNLRLGAEGESTKVYGL